MDTAEVETTAHVVVSSITLRNETRRMLNACGLSFTERPVQLWTATRFDITGPDYAVRAAVARIQRRDDAEWWDGQI